MNSVHMVKIIDEEYNEKLTAAPVLKGLPLRLPSGQLSSRRHTMKPGDRRLPSFITPPPPVQYSDSSSSQRFESSKSSSRKPKASARKKKPVEEKKAVNRPPLMKKPTL